MPKPIPSRTPGLGELRELASDDSEDTLIKATLEGMRKCYFGEAGADADDLAGVEAVVFAWRAGVYPPTWALDAVIPALESYCEKHGEVSIEKLLGLASPGKGKDRLVKSRAKKQEHEVRMLGIWVIRQCFGLSINSCSRASHYDFGDAKPAWKTLASNYVDEKWEAYLNEKYDYLLEMDRAGDEEWAKRLKAHIPNTLEEYLLKFPSQQDRERIFDCFPPGTFPRNLLG